jgi:hypothetical protein
MVIWYFLWSVGIFKVLSFGIFCVHLVILWQLGRFFPNLVHCVKKNLATLLHDGSAGFSRLVDFKKSCAWVN